MKAFYKEAFQYNWMQFSPNADQFCGNILKKAGASDLVGISSRYKQLVLSGQRQSKTLGAVITTLFISALSICCALVEDYIQFAYPAKPLAIAGRVICCVIFLFQFDLFIRINNRKILMLLYLLFIIFTADSVFIQLIFLIIFNIVFFGNKGMV